MTDSAHEEMDAPAVEQPSTDRQAREVTRDDAGRDAYPRSTNPVEDEEKHVDELTEAQKRAAVLMALGMSNTEIARQVGKEPHTITRWKQLEEFRGLVKAAGEAADAKVQADRLEFVAQVAALKLETLQVWRVLLRDDDAGIRLKAAEAIGKL